MTSIQITPINNILNSKKKIDWMSNKMQYYDHKKSILKISKLIKLFGAACYFC